MEKDVQEISVAFKKSAVKGRLCTTFFETEDSTFYQPSCCRRRDMSKQ
jgi:hypothetical protein